MYGGFSEPVGRFSSRLEARWATKFAAWGWNAKYIGDACYWADFIVEGQRIETKPEGEEFVRQAATRALGELWIIEGNPGFDQWWHYDGKNTTTQSSRGEFLSAIHTAQVLR